MPRLVSVDDDYNFPDSVNVRDVNLPANLQPAALSATYVPKWKANTSYAAGDKVLSPNGDVVSAKAGFTSGAAYSAVDWDLSSTYATPASVTALTAGKASKVESFSTLKAALSEGSRSTAVQILGDSTGNESHEWVYKLAEAIRVAYPAWTFNYRLWDDAAQAYAAPVTLQTGTAGERYIDNSAATNTTRRLDTSVPGLTGTIDFRVKVNLSDWTPTSQVNLGGKSGNAGNRSWYVIVHTSGLIGFVFSTDGTALTTTYSTAVPGIADGATSWVRVVFNPNDGAGNRVTKFYKSTDGVTWTQVGTTVTTAGNVTLFNNSAWGYELGGTASGVVSNTIAQLKVYEVQIRDGENGPNIAPALPELWPPYDLNAMRSSGAPVLTIVNGSHPGASSTYLGDSVRLLKLTPNYGQCVTLLSNSHNEGLFIDKVWLDKYETWRLAVEARLPGASTVILTQNPETSASTWYREHRARRLNLLGYARAKNVDIIDTYRAFLDYGAWEANLMTDAVHPNPAGSDLWRDAVKAAFDAAA